MSIHDDIRKHLHIIDAHHHFWDLESDGHWPWIQDQYNEGFFLGDYRAMCHTFLSQQYREVTRGWNIIGTVHCEAERSRDEQVEESAWLEQLHEQDARFPLAAVGHVFFTQPDIDDVLAGHAANPIVKGIRSKPKTAGFPGEHMTGPGTMHDPDWLEGLSKLERYGFSWDLRVPYYHLAEAAEVVAGIPNTMVVINHCGLPLDRSKDQMAIWRHGMEQLAMLPNTVVKVSELGLPGNRWDRPSNEQVVREVLNIFGYERSLFASNLPVATLTAPSFDEVMETILAGAAGASESQLNALFRGTAERIYHLNLSGLDI